MDTLKAKVRETIQKHAMLSYGDGVLAAVSGGPDSIALLHVLCELTEELDLKLEVAHVQHGIRGGEAREDARFAAEMAHRLGLRFHLQELDLPKLKGEKGKGNLEAMAREERYRFFTEVARVSGIRRVAAGHTRDDQVETLLMRLLRGSGRKGLSGMLPVRPLTQGVTSGGLLLIRPLIESTREEVVNYLAELAVSYRTDRTNLDPSLLRNWVRLSLLPELRERMGPGVDERLACLVEILRDEEAIVERVTNERLGQLLHEEVLLSHLLIKEEKGMQRRLVRGWMERVMGDLRAISFQHVEDTLRLLASGSPQAVLSLPRGWELVKEYDSVRLQRGARSNLGAVAYSYSLPLEGELLIPEAGMTIVSSKGSVAEYHAEPSGHEAIFDLAHLPERLTVRNFRPGDRFQPLGMQGHKKVKDLFIEKKVPLSLRRTLPLLQAGKEILWIPCCGRSEVAKVRAGTREVLKVSLIVEGNAAEVLN